MIEKPHEELIKCSQEDKTFFDKCVEGLPTRAGFNGNYLDKDGVEIPYGSEAHIVQHFRTTLDIVNPKAILEIGFNCGWSAALWLNMSDAALVSIDISEKEETLFAASYLENKYPNMFFYKNRKDILELLPNWFNLIFIDGNHMENFIVEDIELAKRLNIPYLLFDDTYIRYGEAIAAINHFPDLILVKDMDNLKLFKWRKL